MTVRQSWQKRTERQTRLFDADGSVRDAELKVMNFRGDARGFAKPGHWEEVRTTSLPLATSYTPSQVGTWSTWAGLDIKDIAWPGGGHSPPPGVPDRFHMRITFLEEPPFVIVADPDPVSDECSMNRGVPCRVGTARCVNSVDY